MFELPYDYSNLFNLVGETFKLRTKKKKEYSYSLEKHELGHYFHVAVLERMANKRTRI